MNSTHPTPPKIKLGRCEFRVVTENFTTKNISYDYIDAQKDECGGYIILHNRSEYIEGSLLSQ